jgi:hypothetical protein
MLAITHATAGRAAQYAALTGTRALLIVQQRQTVFEEYHHRSHT